MGIEKIMGHAIMFLFSSLSLCVDQILSKQMWEQIRELRKVVVSSY